MLTKEQFKKYMEFLKDYEEKLHKAHDAVCNIEKDFTGIAGIAHPIIDKYIDLINDALKLSDIDSDLLWWWIYDCNWGKDHCQIYNKKNKVIAELKDLDELYKYIKKLIRRNK